jgi:hypothetical protein
VLVVKWAWLALLCVACHRGGDVGRSGPPPAASQPIALAPPHAYGAGMAELEQPPAPPAPPASAPPRRRRGGPL